MMPSSNKKPNAKTCEPSPADEINILFPDETAEDHNNNDIVITISKPGQPGSNTANGQGAAVRSEL
jgi:hypothetical protein